MTATRESHLVTTIPLRSLRCRACAYRYRRALGRVEGVTDVRIEALPGAAIVTHERRIDPRLLVEALEAAGADPAAAEIAFPVATPAGGEEAARRIETELRAIDGVDGAAVDLARHEVLAIYRPAAVTADAIRARIEAFGWSPAREAPPDGAADPGQRRAARRASFRAAAATLAATAVTLLGALTGPGALSPFLGLFPDLQASLRRSIAIAPAAAFWLLVAISFATLVGGGRELFRRAAVDAKRRVATRRLLAAAAIGTLAIAATWGAAMTVLGRPAPPLLFGAALWSLAAFLAGEALTLTRVARRRGRETDRQAWLRRTIAAAGWHRGAREERSLSLARWWAAGALAAGAAAGSAWIVAGAGWSVAVLATAAVLLAAVPAGFIAAAAMPVRDAIETLGGKGIAILGGETLDRVRGVGTVATNIRGGVCESRARIAEILLLRGASVEELLGAAASAVPADHPLGDLIRERAGDSGQPRQGAVIGTIAEVERRGISTAAIAEEVSRFESEGKSILAVGEEGRLLGAITIGFEDRPAAAETIGWLNGTGLRTVLLTRHPEGTAAAVAARLGFTAFEGGVARPLESLLLPGSGVRGLRAWVSDGDDGLATGGADVAVTFSATPDRTEREDAVVTTGSLDSVRLLFETAGRAERSAASRARWLLAYHLVALPLAGGVLLPFTGLLPSPFLAAAGSLIALAAVSRR